jgi:hypothetical protein
MSGWCNTCDDSTDPDHCSVCCARRHKEEIEELRKTWEKRIHDFCRKHGFDPKPGDGGELNRKMKDPIYCLELTVAGLKVAHDEEVTRWYDAVKKWHETDRAQYKTYTNREAGEIACDRFERASEELVDLLHDSSKGGQ